MRACERAVVTAVVAALGLLAAHLIGGLLDLPGLAVLDAADRLASVGGIAGLTVLMERSLRRGRSTAVPVALTGQLVLLVGPPLLHADAVGASYDPLVLLLGAVLQVAVTAAVVLAALHLGDAVERVLATVKSSSPRACQAVPSSRTAWPLRCLHATRPPGRAPPVARAA